MKQFGKLPKIINGNIHIDDRGLVEFNNNINFKEIKRFYIVSNFKNNFVRAWHAQVYSYNNIIYYFNYHVDSQFLQFFPPK